MKKTAILIALTLGACSSVPTSYQSYLATKGLETQTPYRFQHCHGYGCKFVTTVNFTANDWTPIHNAFTPAPTSPKEEREVLKTAIAIFEQTAGAQAGTDQDQWGTFRHLGNKQHDCVDESTNTTVYLSLLQQQGLMRFHTVQPPSARFPLIHAGRWPHQSAVITENSTHKFFAVDSWFHNNGHPPEIIPLKQWKEGWKPNRENDRL